MKYVEGLSVQQLIERAKIGSFANSSPEHDVLTICFPFSKKTNDKVGPSALLDRFATLRNFVWSEWLLKMNIGASSTTDNQYERLIMQWKTKSSSNVAIID